MRGFLAQHLTPAAQAIGDAPVLGKDVKVGLLDLNLPSNFCPVPDCGEVKTGKCPSFDLFPGAFGEKRAALPELVFDLV